MTIELNTKGTESFYREVVSVIAQYQNLLKEHEQEIYDYLDDNSIDVPRY